MWKVNLMQTFLFPSSIVTCVKVNVGNDHEMPQSEMNFPLQETEVEKLNLQSGTYCKPNGQPFSQ